MNEALSRLCHLFRTWNVDIDDLEIRFIFKKATAAYAAKEHLRKETAPMTMYIAGPNFTGTQILGIRLRFQWEERKVTTGEA